MTDTNDPYLELREHFTTDDSVTVNEGRGSQGIKFGKKMFVMFYKGDLIVQLSPERVGELIADGIGVPFDPGTGKPMKNRVLIPSARKDAWIDLCEESKHHVQA